VPRGDGTGPAGMGPMTGRAAGFCAGYPVPGFLNAYGSRRAAGAPYSYPPAWGRAAYPVGWGGYPAPGWFGPIGFGRGRAFGRGFGRGPGFGRGYGRGRGWWW